MIRRPRKYSIGWLLILLWQASLCGANELPASVTAALKQANIPIEAAGVFVQEVEEREPLFALNGQTAFSPASTMKLVTTGAALDLLGPAFTWKTQVYASGVQSGDVLQGDLIFRGGGDPKLVIEKFWLLLRQIRATGIREIRGNVLVDRSAFEAVRYDAAQFDNDPLKPYNAPPDAMLLNYGILRFQFFPEAGRTRIAVDPPLAGYTLAAPLQAGGGCGDWQSRLLAGFGTNGARFDGSYASDCGTRTWYVHPYGMSYNQYFAAIFRQMWRDAGGVFDGMVDNGNVPVNARPVATWESPSLAEVIRDINKFSNNVMARQLLLTLGGGDAPANAARGAQSVRSWLSGKGIAAPELQIENGSGLSREERMAPASMGQLLLVAYKSPTMPEFLASLPIAGYDGTMRHRSADQGVAGNAHIKTGTLDGVKAEAGYVQAASGKRYVIVFFVNHANAARAEAAQDALLAWLYAHG
ncbi:MAG: D-alanyl-D-alanine carboxypeptidase/D-alanyl-D-alanine-endopeptidase [Burkholderiaceae bacterium]|nr:D-alanyl-D-alanine carboxypeptidase/D-alanyl-D-alanine-endopeptidase [Burkholderiaceae bacterium]